jgi:hypothetical protein
MLGIDFVFLGACRSFFSVPPRTLDFLAVTAGVTSHGHSPKEFVYKMGFITKDILSNQGVLYIKIHFCQV